MNDPVDLGPLSEGWRTQPDTAAYGNLYAVDPQAWDQGARPASAAGVDSLLRQAAPEQTIAVVVSPVPLKIKTDKNGRIEQRPRPRREAAEDGPRHEEDRGALRAADVLVRDVERLFDVHCRAKLGETHDLRGLGRAAEAGCGISRARRRPVA